MAAPAPGVLQKLLEGMRSGTPKPVGEHRSAVLQVMDIVPADLDEHDLWPRHNRFYVKVSDSCNSVYAALPPDQADLVLSNRLQLGQFVQVERLDPGTPVPVLRGTKLIPGRHPLMGTPLPMIKVRAGKADSGGGGGTGVAAATKFGCGSGGGGSSASVPRRGSWDMEAASLKCTILDSEVTTPVTAASSPSVTRGRSGSVCLKRASVGGALLSKATADLSTAKAERSALLRQSCRSTAKLPRSNSMSRIPRSPCNGEKKGTSTPSRPEPSCPIPLSDSKQKPNKSLFSGPFPSSPRPSPTTTLENGKGSRRVTLPGKLGLIGKELMHQKEEAHKVALQALRDASAAEILLRMLRMFSDLSSSAAADTPASCFDQFLSFHKEILQAVSDMEEIHAAAASASQEQTGEEPPVLQEIHHNTSHVNAAAKRKTTAASKAISFLTDPNQLKKAILGKHPRSGSKLNDSKGAEEETKVQQQNPASSTTFANPIRTAKLIQTEAANWFIQFLDAALESGLKKEGCPQSLILKVINWVEVEQCHNSNKPFHPRAAQIVRKLRIKVKNP